MVLSSSDNHCTCNIKCELPKMPPPSSSSSSSAGATRTLRFIPWISFFLSLALAIPLAVGFSIYTPAIGIVFLAISCTISLFDHAGGSSLLRRIFSPKYEYRIVLGNEENEETPMPAKPIWLLLGDLVMTAIMGFLFSFTIAEMALTPYWRYYHHGEILGTFASLPYLATLYVTFQCYQNDEC
jgi:hypothetical protein